MDSETLWMSGPLWDTPHLGFTLQLEGSITCHREDKSMLNHFFFKNLSKYSDSLGLIVGLRVWWIEQ